MILCLLLSFSFDGQDLSNTRNRVSSQFPTFWILSKILGFAFLYFQISQSGCLEMWWTLSVFRVWYSTSILTFTVSSIPKITIQTSALIWVRCFGAIRFLVALVEVRWLTFIDDDSSCQRTTVKCLLKIRNNIKNYQYMICNWVVCRVAIPRTALYVYWQKPSNL